MRDLVRRLERGEPLSLSEYACLIDGRGDVCEYLFEKSDKKRRLVYGTDIYIRGLIEFSSFCKNNCFYCGLRKDNITAARYRLTKEEILNCCDEGYDLGFRTFVLQSGEDMYYTDRRICDIVSSIKSKYPDCAVTLSIGEKSKESYKAYFSAGADRYLLRHETANGAHYAKLHPSALSSENRRRCLYALKEIGYAVGTGFMVGSPYQTTQNLAEDMCFLREFQPDMVGIGPFVPHHETPFANMPAGNAELVLFMLALIRLTLPEALIPATTALATIAKDIRSRAIRAGANVVMPNLSPGNVRQKYELYNNKAYSESESAQGLALLKNEILTEGYKIVTDRGDKKHLTGKSI